MDLKDNKLIVDGGNLGTFDGAAYSGLTGLIAGAYDFSAWDLPGITTSMPDAGPTIGRTTLAIGNAEDTFYAGGTFGGIPVDSNNILIMYTWAGDVDLNGFVDAVDYGTIDQWIEFPVTTGYGNGDLNYDGVIDAVDYGIIDNGIQLQGPPMPRGNISASELASVAAVPEPAQVGMLLLLAPLRRRGRRRSRNVTCES